MLFLHLAGQESSLDPLVVTRNGIKIQHCFRMSQPLLEGSNLTRSHVTVCFIKHFLISRGKIQWNNELYYIGCGTCAIL